MRGLPRRRGGSPIDFCTFVGLARAEPVVLFRPRLEAFTSSPFSTTCSLMIVFICPLLSALRSTIFRVWVLCLPLHSNQGLAYQADSCEHPGIFSERDHRTRTPQGSRNLGRSGRHSSFLFRSSFGRLASCIPQSRWVYAHPCLPQIKSRSNCRWQLSSSKSSERVDSLSTRHFAYFHMSCRGADNTNQQPSSNIGHRPTAL